VEGGFAVGGGGGDAEFKGAGVGGVVEAEHEGLLEFATAGDGEDIAETG
jgi:hypothetical protein